MTNLAKPSEESVQLALDVILSDTKAYPTSLNYAINYVTHAKRMTGEELRVQCLYILANLTYWRHPSAKQVRTILKEFTKP